MKTNRKTYLLAFLAIVLVLVFSSCSNNRAENASLEVNVRGAAKSMTRSSSPSDLSFASADIYISDVNVSDQLTTTQTTESNDAEFTATVEVEVVNSTVEYRVEAREGFVFDEWEIDRKKLRKDRPTNLREILRELNEITKTDNETITINPDYVKYLRPTFERGIYVADATKLTETITAYDLKDDEFTVKIAEGKAGTLDLTGIINKLKDTKEDELEIKIIGGYDANWNVSGKTEIESLTIPNTLNDIDIEIEFRNIKFSEFDMASLNEEKVELEMENCSVTTLKNPSKIVSNMVIEKVEGTTAATFINSDAPYDANSSYYHSIIRGETIGEVKGEKNIVVKAGDGTDTKNLYLSTFGKDYKTDDSELITQLTTASPLNEDTYPNLEDYLEEDIEGRDRFLAEDDDVYPESLKVSYGPYEYIYFD